MVEVAWTPRVRVSIRAEKEKLTNNLTFNLRCPCNVWSVRQWSFAGSPARPSLPSSFVRKQLVIVIMLTMEEALKQTGALRFAAGNIVKGTIIEVRPKEVLVDIGYKSEGVISGDEFDDIKTVKVGDQIDVLIEKLEDKEGMVVLSKEKAEFKQNWERILTICNEGGTSSARSRPSSKAACSSTSAWRPSCRRRRSTSSRPRTSPQFVGNTYDFKVVKINQERQNIVLSRRELIEQERPNAARSCWPR